MLFVNKDMKFVPAPFRPGTQDYDLWYWKEEYAKGSIDIVELEHRIEWALKNPPCPPPKPKRPMQPTYQIDRITVGKEWR